MLSRAQSSNLDILRSIAVLLVVFGHFVEYSGIGSAFFAPYRRDIDELTWFAVLMFFVHTALVLMGSLERLEARSETRLVRRFYIRRATRIYPLSIAVVVLCIALRLPAFPGDPICVDGIGNRISNLLLIQNVTGDCNVTGPLWSLPFEVQMYILLPFLYWLGKRIRQPAIILLCGFAAWYVSRKLVPRDLLRYAPWFCMGIYAFFRRTRLSLPAPAFAGALLFLFGARVLLAHLHSFLSGWIFFGAGILFCHFLPSFRDIRARAITVPAQAVARYSYGIYLLHVPALILVLRATRGQQTPIRVSIFLASAAVASWIFYHALEHPMIAMGARVASRMEPGEHASARAAAGS